MATAIVKDLHSGDFIEKYCTDQVGADDIAIAPQVAETLGRNLASQIASGILLVEKYERGDLIEIERFHKLSFDTC